MAWRNMKGDLFQRDTSLRRGVEADAQLPIRAQSTCFVEVDTMREKRLFALWQTVPELKFGDSLRRKSKQSPAVCQDGLRLNRNAKVASAAQMIAFQPAKDSPRMRIAGSSHITPGLVRSGKPSEIAPPEQATGPAHSFHSTPE